MLGCWKNGLTAAANQVAVVVEEANVSQIPAKNVFGTMAAVAAVAHTLVPLERGGADSL